MQTYGSPSIARSTLTIEFFLYGPTALILKDPSLRLKWFVRALGRFTNFRTVELHVERRASTATVPRCLSISKLLWSLSSGLQTI